MLMVGSPVHCTVLTGHRLLRIGVVIDPKSKPGGSNTPMTIDQCNAEDRLSKEVENSVENAFIIRPDNVPTFTHPPGYRVEEPDDQGEDAAKHVYAIDV